MRKYSKYLILLLLFVLFPLKADAVLCENEDKVKWQSLAKNVTVSYDAIEKNGKVTFTVTFSNLSKGLILKDVRVNKDYTYKKSELTLSGLTPGESYRFELYTDAGFCTHEILYTLYAVVPSYNYYHKDAICEGVKEYALCQKWGNINYSYEEWKKKVQAYKDSLIEAEEDNPTIKEKTVNWIEKIVDFYSRVYYIILPILIIGGAIIIFIYNKKRELF